jgi:hypothetical protein
MKNFYEIILELQSKQGMKDNFLEQTGSVILDSVLSCYTNPENKSIYSSGKIKLFRNREENYLFKALNDFSSAENFSSREEILEKYGDELNSHREIYEVNTVYDALKYYRSQGKTVDESVNFLARNFLGHEKNSSLMLRHYNISEFELDKDSIRLREYINYVHFLKKSLRREFKARF